MPHRLVVCASHMVCTRHDHKNGSLICALYCTRISANIPRLPTVCGGASRGAVPKGVPRAYHWHWQLCRMTSTLQVTRRPPYMFPSLHHDLRRLFHGFPQSVGEQVVVLSQVLASEATLGYEDISNIQVLRFNGTPVVNLRYGMPPLCSHLHHTTATVLMEPQHPCIKHSSNALLK